MYVYCFSEGDLTLTLIFLFIAKITYANLRMLQIPFCYFFCRPCFSKRVQSFRFSHVYNVVNWRFSLLVVAFFQGFQINTLAKLKGVSEKVVKLSTILSVSVMIKAEPQSGQGRVLDSLQNNSYSWM